MRKDFVRTKVIVLIIILVMSSFGLFVAGSDFSVRKFIKPEVTDDASPVETTWEPPAIQYSSRATFTKAGTRIQNNGTDDYGYFLGNIDTVTYKSDASTLDDYFSDSDLSSPDATGKKRPVFPGSVDIVYDLTIESIWRHDDNGTNGDEMLYGVEIEVDYDDVELRDEADWSWDDAPTTPFHEQDKSETNIFSTRQNNWVHNNLTIDGKPADQFDASYDHSTARHIVSDDNTIANDNLGNDHVFTANVFNDSYLNDDDYIDVRNDCTLNATFDPSVSPPEYRDLIRINTGKKTFAGFTFDVKPDAEPGVYRFPVKISYDYQKWAPLPSDDFSPRVGSAPDYTFGIPPGELHKTNGFGDFQPYFWVPYNRSTQAIVVDISDENRDSKVSECSFTKRNNYYDPGGAPDYDKDDFDGENSFEPIPDISTNVAPYSRFDLNASTYKGYLDWDGDDVDSDWHTFTDMDTYNYDFTQYGSGNPPGGLECLETDKFDTNWNNNFHLDTGDDYTSTTYPTGLPLPDHDYSFLKSINPADDGNGSWQSPSLNKDWYNLVAGQTPVDSNNIDGNAHAAWEKHFVWDTATEEYWLQVRIYSSSIDNELNNSERGLILEKAGAADEYVTDGDQFEKFVIGFSNQEYDHITATGVFDFKYKDIMAELMLGTENEKYFTVFAPGIARIKELEDTTENLEFRLDSEANTPPGYYYFTLMITYTKLYYEEDTNDPRNDVTVDVTEYIMVEFYVEFSPDLAVKDAKLAAQPGMRVLSPTLTIDTGTNKTEINFTIENTGNVDLIGDAQYLDYMANHYPTGILGDLGMYIAGVELLGSPYLEEDEINNYPVFDQIDPLPIPVIPVGGTLYINVPVKINHNWDNTPGIYRVHLNYRGFYYDPGNVSAASPASKYVYTEIRWTPTAGSPDKAYAYRDTSGDGQIGGGDASDETDGIFTDIEIIPFQPDKRELKVKSFLINGVDTDQITQGTTSVQLEVEFENPITPTRNFDMHDLQVMLNIGDAVNVDWFSKFSHYDIDNSGVSENILTARRTAPLVAGDTWNVTFVVNGIDRLIPTGEHHLPINYIYDFEELPGFWSSYGIVWNDDGARYNGYIDEDTDGVYDAGADDHELITSYNYDSGYIRIFVLEDGLLDVIAVQNTVTGGQLNFGNNIRNSNLQIDLTSREYVKYTQITAELETEAMVKTSSGAMVKKQILENPITKDNAPIEGVFTDPADDELDATGGTNTIFFNVDLIDPVMESDTDIIHGGVFTFNMTIYATNDDTNTREQYIIPVNIRVMPLDPILMITNVEILDVEDGSDDIIRPGEEFDMRITLENVGDDYAREIYVTLSNDWYEDDPFYLIDEFVTSISAYEDQMYSQNCIDCDTTQTLYKRVPNSTSLGDLGVDHTVDIVDSERVLMSPAAMVSRLYIEEIEPDSTATITFRMLADTHMQKGKAYDEIIILEFRDSYGSIYRWNGGPQYTDDMAYAITIHTGGSDDWPPKTTVDLAEHEAQIMNYSLGLAIAVIIIILLILAILWMMMRKKKMEEEEGEEEEEFKPPSEEEEELEEEEEEEEAIGPEEEEEEEEEAEIGEEEEEEEEWGAPEEEEKVEEEEEEWGALEEEEAPAVEEEEEEWSTPSSEEEEEEEWSLDKEDK